MATYIKTLQFGPTSGGKYVTSDKLDPLINDTLEKIQNEGGKILDVKIHIAPLAALNSIVSTYLIIYDASRPAG
ncbi:MAG: hypothetical protein ABR958_04045 [Dehalococcoidales bacterium]